MSLSDNIALLGLQGAKKSSPVVALVVAAISFSMYIVGFVVDNKCVKNKGNEKTYRAMKWVLALGLCSLITMFLTILIASSGKGQLEKGISSRLKLAAGIVTFICTIVGSGYGIWASLKCEDKLKRTRLGLHITAIVFALLAVLLANREVVKKVGTSARSYADRQATSARSAVQRRAQAIRAQQAAAAAPAASFGTWQNQGTRI